jgi:hypothetical protein
VSGDGGEAVLPCIKSAPVDGLGALAVFSFLFEENLFVFMQLSWQENQMPAMG